MSVNASIVSWIFFRRATATTNSAKTLQRRVGDHGYDCKYSGDGIPCEMLAYLFHVRKMITKRDRKKRMAHMVVDGGRKALSEFSNDVCILHF